MIAPGFVTGNVTADLYLSSCWGYPPIGSCSIDSEPFGPYDQLNPLIQSLFFQFSGFCAFAVVFGLSLIPCFISLHYLFRNWKHNISHIVVTVFTVVISAFNIAIFGLRVLTMGTYFLDSLCPSQAGPDGISPALAFTLTSVFIKFIHLGSPSESSDSFAVVSEGAGLSLSLIPMFLWISDAFLLYRTWIIWVHHRKYTSLPALVYLASLITGVIWLIQVMLAFMVNEPRPESSSSFLNPTVQFQYAVSRWIPALGFSCALDALATGMIAGRLIYHHRKQRKLTESHSTIYLPLVTIFIESAALSLIAKILQLSVPVLWSNPIVVPLCTISSNLIVLRKALGADVGQMLANENQEISAMRFHRPSRPQMNTNDDSIPSGFEAQLIRTIGGHTIDFGPAKAKDSEQTSLSDAPKA